ncbi:unnamed protein product, partial [Polarella glacialis]
AAVLGAASAALLLALGPADPSSQNKSATSNASSYGTALALAPPAAPSYAALLRGCSSWMRPPLRSWPRTREALSPRARAPRRASQSLPSSLGSGSAARASTVSEVLRRTRWLLLGAALGLALGLGFSGGAAQAAASAVASEARPHLGQRLALFLRSNMQLPDWAILVLLSAMPLVELRGGVPVGLWMGMSVPQVMLLCILGNMIPIPLIILALRSPRIKRLLQPLLNRAATKMEAIGAHDRWVGVAAFVGVPLPGTGAWTGAMVAYLLGMEFFE